MKKFFLIAFALINFVGLHCGENTEKSVLNKIMFHLPFDHGSFSYEDYSKILQGVHIQQQKEKEEQLLKNDVWWWWTTDANEETVLSEPAKEFLARSAFKN